MKTNHFTGFGVSTVLHIGLALALMPVLFAEENKPEEPPLLPVELSMFEPKAPEPAPEPVPQVAPDPPPPKPKPKPKEKPKPEKKVEKPLPKPKPEKDLRKEEEERERRKALQREREEQQRQEQEQQRQAQQRSQQERAARAAAAAQNAVPVITNPRYRRPPSPPDYPRRALESGTEGTTVVRATVSTSGNVTTARVHHSSGNASLDSAAVKAVRSWAFMPATRGGANIESIVQVPVHFKLN